MSENFFGGNSFFRVKLHKFLEEISGNRVDLGLFQVGGEVGISPCCEATAFDRFPGLGVFAKGIFS